MILPVTFQFLIVKFQYLLARTSRYFKMESSTESFNSNLKLTETMYFCNGTNCFLCFLIGTFGNFISFLYFKSKKRDISNVIYMLITANDIVVSITVLPVGISALSQEQPGIIFGNHHGCVAWCGVWMIAVILSTFLVSCLCSLHHKNYFIAATFPETKIRYLVIAVVLFLVINSASVVLLFSLDGTRVKFMESYSGCFSFTDHLTELYALAVNENVFYTTPAFVVAISCVISVVVLTRRNRNVQQRRVQQSRNRATFTILLFALLYGFCNLPFVMDRIVYTISVSTNDWEIYYNFYRSYLGNFNHLQYDNIINPLLLAANSAANPIFYFWRMPALREYIMSGIRRMLGLNREAGKLAETHRRNTEVENIRTVRRLPSSGHSETGL